jgi:hypothetical protein
MAKIRLMSHDLFVLLAGQISQEPPPDTPNLSNLICALVNRNPDRSNFRATSSCLGLVKSHLAERAGVDDEAICDDWQRVEDNRMLIRQPNSNQKSTQTGEE